MSKSVLEIRSELTALKQKIERQNGELEYECISQIEFDALIIALQENYPISSLTFVNFYEYGYPDSDCIRTYKAYQSSYPYWRHERQGIPYDTLYQYLNRKTQSGSRSNAKDFNFVRLMESLLGNRQLISLSLDKLDEGVDLYDLEPKDVESLTRVLSINNTLTYLRLINCSIESHTVALRNVLLNNYSILEFKYGLSSNNKRDQIMQPIEQLLIRNRAHLRQEVITTLETHGIAKEVGNIVSSYNYTFTPQYKTIQNAKEEPTAADQSSSDLRFEGKYEI